MARQIPKQYWKFHTAESLAWYDIRIALEESFDNPSFFAYQHALKKIAVQRYEEFTQANIVFEAAAQQVMIEAFSTVAAGGLELKLTFEDKSELPYEALIPYATLPTQQRFRETRQEASQLLALSNLLVREYNESLDYYAQLYSNKKVS